MRKTREEIQQDILDVLASKTGINSTLDGSISKAIVDAITEEMSDLYIEMDIMKNQAYLTTSQGTYTELIADLVGARRFNDETDDELKERARTQVYRAAGGNRVAIEKAARDVPGVADVEFRKYGMGVGSFIIYVYPLPGQNDVRVLDNVKNKLQDVVSDGIYFEVKKPKDVVIDLDIAVVLKASLSDMTKKDIRNKVEVALYSYFNSLTKNEVLYINEIIQRVMEVSSDILDMGIVNLSQNGNARYISNVFPKDEEMFVPGIITVS